ncbi:hypothetical protein AG1IA_09945 [Rhizoctonia solani AG-1 IA]|uniref:Uncharacterized protein n=1 Tax=Thanatephorus cucumeris (strain AG1-IA) TaxID=983506 RepID=L8WDI7_THACA|nr:hypothetical protein AG1IA_09945 [Rhizoctonia solani AG-1 IA]
MQSDDVIWSVINHQSSRSYSSLHPHGVNIITERRPKISAGTNIMLRDFVISSHVHWPTRDMQL